MRRAIPHLAVVAALAALLGGAFLVVHIRSERALDELAQKTRDSLIFVEGGRFRPGYYLTTYRAPNGEVSAAWGAGAMPPLEEVALESYYLSAYETSYADFNLYLRDQGHPETPSDVAVNLNAPDRGASLSFEEATKYCAWLGRQTGLTLRLPTEAEWEYAARSRGQNPIWATDDGGYEPGRNVNPTGRDLTAAEQNPPIGAYPPNPMGFYNLADGLYEWVSDRREGDPAGAAVFKGGSHRSSGFYETIPSRGVVEAYTAEHLAVMLSPLSADATERTKRLRRRDNPQSPDARSTAARCAVTEPRPPATSGFGRPAGEGRLSPPYSGRE